MPALSIDAIISLLVGIPSLVVAILTYWEARRTRYEQVRLETVEIALIDRRYLPTQIAHTPISSPSPPAVINNGQRNQHMLPAATVQSLSTSALPQQVFAPTSQRSPAPEQPPRPSQNSDQEHTVTHTSQTP